MANLSGFNKPVSREQLITGFFFAVLLIIGFAIYQDYGISWDEPIQKGIGMDNIHFITGEDDNLLLNEDRFYGPFFEVFLIGIETVFHPVNLRETYFYRHLFTFLTFFVGVFFFYLLARNLFKRSTTALLCSIALVLSPRIFENAFYNSKDIPLLVFFIICFAALFKYMDTGKSLLLILLAFYSALTVTIRVAGLLIPVLVVVVLLIKHRQRLLAVLPRLSIFGLLFTGSTILFWPVLWANPIRRLIQALGAMSHFQWDGKVLFMGDWYSQGLMPWNYLAIWILISTPLVYSALFCVGNFLLGLDTLRFWKKIFSFERLKLLFIAAWFYGPLLLVILMRSSLYDSWRHIFFIYPAFLLLAFWGFEKITDRLLESTGWVRLLGGAIFAALILSFCLTSVSMVRAHPYEQMVFNRLAGSSLAEIQQNYDLDYWGLAYRKGLEYIAAHDPDPEIKYVSETTPGSYKFILPLEEQSRLFPTNEKNKAKYLITGYRYTKNYPGYDTKKYPGFEEVYSVEVEGVRLLSVYRLK